MLIEREGLSEADLKKKGAEKLDPAVEDVLALCQADATYKACVEKLLGAKKDNNAVSTLDEDPEALAEFVALTLLNKESKTVAVADPKAADKKKGGVEPTVDPELLEKTKGFLILDFPRSHKQAYYLERHLSG